MFDRRVFRGSTNAAMVIPSGSYPDQLFRANKKKYDPKELEQRRAQAAEEFFTRDVKTPEAPSGKQNIDIQTDQFVSELTDKAPMYEIACQTTFNIAKVETPWAMPQLRGISKKCLIEDNELFLFNDEVEPLLSVLCGKTLEHARMEVLEEEELAEMKRK
jgi:radial spoke head protein 3